MRPEWGEQNTTGANCVGGVSSVKGGVSSARIEARSLACMRARGLARSIVLACEWGGRFVRWGERAVRNTEAAPLGQSQAGLSMILTAPSEDVGECREVVSGL